MPSYALEREPGNTRVMSNLVAVSQRPGPRRGVEGSRGKLERMEPNPPFSYFNRGRAAMRVGDFAAARDLFAKEVDRAPYYHEFHFWLAVAYIDLGDVDQANRELKLAMETSTTRNDRALYAVKLERIKANRDR